jgi:hypothetical protein
MAQELSQADTFLEKKRWGMTTDAYLALALAALTAHLLFNIWVVFGAATTSDRPRLAGLHVASVLWGVVMENAPWQCPLTLAENWFKSRAGLEPYQGPFVLHYLHAVVSPSLPLWVLQWGAICVGLANLTVYAGRYTHVHYKAI